MKQLKIYLWAGFAALFLAGCGSSSDGGSAEMANPADPDSVARSIDTKLGNLEAVLASGNPPPASNNQLAPQATGSTELLKATPGEKVSFQVNFSGDSALSSMFLKVVGSNTFFSVDLASAKTTVAKASTQAIEVTLPDNISGGSFCVGVSAQTASSDVSNTLTRCIEVDAEVVPLNRTPQTTEERIAAARSLTAKLRQVARNAEDLEAKLEAGTVFSQYDDIFAAFDPEMGGVEFDASQAGQALSALAESFDAGVQFLQDPERNGSSTTIDGITYTIIEGNNVNTTVGIQGTSPDGVLVNLNASFPVLETDTRQQLNGSISGSVEVPSQGSSNNQTEPDLKLALNNFTLSVTRNNGGQAQEEPNLSDIDQISFNGTVTASTQSRDGSNRRISFTASLGGGGVLCTSQTCANQALEGEASFNPTLIDVAFDANNDQQQELKPRVRVSIDEASARNFSQEQEISASNFLKGSAELSALVDLPGVGTVEAEFELNITGFSNAAQQYLFTANLGLSLDGERIDVSAASNSNSGEVENIQVTANQVTIQLIEPSDNSPFDGQILFDNDKIADIDSGAGDSPIIRYVDGTFESLF